MFGLLLFPADRDEPSRPVDRAAFEIAPVEEPQQHIESRTKLPYGIVTEGDETSVPQEIPVMPRNGIHTEILFEK